MYVCNLYLFIEIKNLSFKRDLAQTGSNKHLQIKTTYIKTQLKYNIDNKGEKNPKIKHSH